MGVRIAFASYGTFDQFIRQIKPFYTDEVEFVILNALFEDLKGEVRRLEKDHSVDVFVGSGGNGRFLEKYVQETPFVKVKVTGFDFLLALKKVWQYSRRAGLITYQERLPFIAAVKELLNVEVTERVYRQTAEVDQILQELYNQGIEDVIGTAYVLERAALMGMRGHYIWSVDGVKAAADTAVQIAIGKKQDAQKAHKLAGILQTVHEGVIVTDQNGVVSEFNPSAEKILKISREDVLGRQVREVLPNTRLNAVIENQREEYNKIQDVGNVKILTNRCPIFSDGRLIGALATFQNVDDVSEAEEKIRRKLYTKGFVARTRFRDMVGRSPAFQNVVHIGKEYAGSGATILISGETGTGKELFAQSIHNESNRSQKPFVAINCAALPPNILESELFGYEEGAFTGSRRGGKRGVFELAHEGTIFLDEIGEVSMEIQLRFLRVLEQREVFRLGGEKVVPVDIRVIAATNKNLWKLVKQGRFREDLYYRLNVLAVHLPPLRERTEDIPLLMDYFLKEFRPDLGAERREELAALPALASYVWPGNIRELKNTAERMAVLYKEDAKTHTDLECLAKQALIDHIEDVEEIAAPRDSVEQRPAGGFARDWAGDLNRDYNRREREDILAALCESGGSRGEAAKLLGISRSTLWRRIQKLGLQEMFQK